MFHVSCPPLPTHYTLQDPAKCFVNKTKPAINTSAQMIGEVKVRAVEIPPQT